MTLPVQASHTLKETAFIEGLLRELADYVRARYGERHTVDISAKRDANDLVTEVDVAVQQQAQRRIAEAFPHDRFIGEEEGCDVIPSEVGLRAWVMDPIDGTQNFVRSMYPAFGISLAFVEDGVIRASGVMMPIDNDLFLAEHGGGTLRNGQLIRVSDVPSVELARLEVDFGGRHVRARTLEVSSELMRQVGQIRCHCAAVIGLCSVACADTDAYIHVGLKPWDYAASVLIVEEAGGVVSRMDGSPIRVFGDRHDVIATNGRFHAELLGTLTL